MASEVNPESIANPAPAKSTVLPAIATAATMAPAESLSSETVAESPSRAGRCASCEQRLIGPYCYRCGEKQIGPEDYSLAKFGAHALDLLTHFDFKLFRSLGLLISRPGGLTERYLRGNRQPYLKPLQLFVIVNVAFFLSLHFYGWNTFTTPLASNLEHSSYGDWAKPLIDAKVAASGGSLAEYETRFDTASGKASKTLIFLIIPMYAGVLALVQWRKRRYFVEHIVFAAHLMAFILVLQMTMMNLISIAVDALEILEFENVIGTSALLIALLIYFFFAFGTAYSDSKPWAAAKAVVATAGFVPLLFLYRFVLLLVCYLLV